MNKKAYGFTIVELLIVIVVIGILAAISIVAYNGIQNRSHNTTVQADLSNNIKKLEEYRILNGSYPVDFVQFRQAGLKFSLNSYRHAVYCQKGGSAQPEYAFVLWSNGGDRYGYTPSGGKVNYTGVADTHFNTCSRVGLPDADTGTWLKGSGDWGTWVVY